MFKTILVPVDPSHAEAGKAMINVAGGIIEESKERAQETLKEIAREADVQASVEVRSGKAYWAILDAAEERNADLIVVASHRPGLQHFLLGSTASRVVRHATCTVLVKR